VKALSSVLSAGERAQGYSKLVAITPVEHAVLIHLLTLADDDELDLLKSYSARETAKGMLGILKLI